MPAGARLEQRKVKGMDIRGIGGRIMAAALVLSTPSAMLFAEETPTAGSVVINGVTWQYLHRDDVAKTVSLGQHATMSTSYYLTAIPKDTVLDASEIPWTIELDGSTYTVTMVGQYAFAGCKKLTGTLRIPSFVTRTGYRAFWNTGITKVETLGGIVDIMSYTFYNSGSLAGEFPDLSQVRKYSLGPFLNCPGLTGEAKLNSSLESIGERFFENTGLEKVRIPRSVGTISKQAFMKTKLKALAVPGPVDVSSGEQKKSTVNVQGLFDSCTGLKAVVFGKNTVGSNLDAGTMLNNVSGCTVFLPANGGWTGLVAGGTGNSIVTYGPDQDFDLAIDDLAHTLTATPKTESAFLKILEAAPLLKEYCAIETRIATTNAFEVSEGAVTAEMLGNVRFDTPLVLAGVKTQAQLDDVLAALSDDAPLAIDARGATEQLTLPPGRKLRVMVGGGSKYSPGLVGLTIHIRQRFSGST